MFNWDVYRTLPVGEQRLCDWQFGRLSGFWTAVWKAIATADNSNLERLALAFPDEVEAYKRFSYEPGYWQGIQEKLLGN